MENRLMSTSSNESDGSPLIKSTKSITINNTKFNSSKYDLDLAAKILQYIKNEVCDLKYEIEN